MPPTTTRTRSYAPILIATLTVLVFVFTVAAGAAPRPRGPKPIPAGSGTGLSAVYVDQTGASVSRVDPKIDFAWGSGSPAPSLRADDFSARWTGELEPRLSETYTISTLSDDGIRLWLDGRLLIDNWTEHSATQNSVDAGAAGRPPLPDQDRVLRADRVGNCALDVGEPVAAEAGRAEEPAVPGRLGAAPAGEHGPVRVVDGPGRRVDLRGAGDGAADRLRLGLRRVREQGRVLRQRDAGGHGHHGSVRLQLEQRAGGDVQRERPRDRRRRRRRELSCSQHRGQVAAAAAERHRHRVVRSVLRQPGLLRLLGVADRSAGRLRLGLRVAGADHQPGRLLGALERRAGAALLADLHALDGLGRRRSACGWTVSS